ncbi:hypothetical protein HDU84_006189 [Entophlyctis sp. JEL0112]|nr:hypothetical protein HDU84_006189 [Entophlyctis sp. JEL0112]
MFLVFSGAQDMVTLEHSPRDFLQMGHLARTHYIIYLLLHNTQSSLIADLARNQSVEQFIAYLAELAARLESILYPWIRPTYSSVRAIQQSIKVGSVGFVMTCGNPHFYVAYHLILSLRHVFNITEPVVVYYAGTRDLSAARIAALKALPNTRVENILTVFPRETHFGAGWSHKPYAVIAAAAMAQFETVLFIDADVAFLRTPLDALDSARFRRYGALFFHDRKLRADDDRGGRSVVLMARWIFSRLSPRPSRRATSHGMFLRGASSEEMESGFMALNMSNPGVLFLLLFAAKLNGRQERHSFYKAAYGDKETYWFAAETLRVPYDFNPSYVGSIGVKDEAKSNANILVICEGRAVHLNEQNEPFWMHGGSVLEADYRTNGPPFVFSNFSHMAFQHSALAEEFLWYPGIHCINQQHAQTHALTEQEAQLIQTYKDMFRHAVPAVP